MSWKQFAASLVQSLAWPTVVLVLAIVLRGSLVDLVLRLKRIKHKDTELEFEERVKKIESTIAAPGAGHTTVSATESDLASIAPRAAVMEAWIGLESLIYRKAMEVGKLEAKKHQVPFSAAIQILHDAGSVEPKAMRSIIEMRDLRNKVAHFEDFEVEPAAAKRYSELARELAKTLR